MGALLVVAMPAWSRWGRRWALSLALVAVLALPLALLLPSPGPARAASALPPRSYLCEGDPLTAELVRGPMDDPSIPDPSAAPVPVGGWVVLRWRGLSLQLPRTNNAGQASFSDGKWWWSLEDPTHPRFRLRQSLGDPRDFACVEATPTRAGGPG
jgi:hypothetical protein